MVCNDASTCWPFYSELTEILWANGVMEFSALEELVRHKQQYVYMKNIIYDINLTRASVIRVLSDNLNALIVGAFTATV